jgi:hypothetical protein
MENTFVMHYVNLNLLLSPQQTRHLGLDPIQNCDSPALDYLAGCLGYHSDDCTEMDARDPGLAIAAEVDCFDWNFHPKAQMVPGHVERCSLSARHMPGKGRYQHELRLVLEPGRFHLWNVPKVTARLFQLVGEVHRWCQCLHIA